MNKALNLAVIGYIIYLVFAVIFSLPFAHDILTPSSSETISIRRNYYPGVTARIFENKLTYIFERAQRNFFEAIDINRVFFSSHPRERAGVNEYSVAHYLFIPLFLLGLTFSNPTRRLSLVLWIVSICVIVVMGARNDLIAGLTAWPLYLNVFGGIWIAKQYLS